MTLPLKKKKYYDAQTKMEVVLARKEGMSYKQIQQKFQIKDRKSIYIWVQWFQNGESYRFEQKPGYNYNKRKTNIKLNPYYNEIQKKIKDIFLLKLKRNDFKDTCLDIINQYRNQFSLNQIIKWLGIARSSYYNWLRPKKEKPFFWTNLEIQIQKICHQHKSYNNVGKNCFVLGYRRVYQELLNQNIKVNPKTVYLKMKKLNLLCQTHKNRYLKKI